MKKILKILLIIILLVGASKLVRYLKQPKTIVCPIHNKKNFPLVIHYKNGQLKIKREVKKGKNIWQEYYENGQMRLIGEIEFVKKSIFDSSLNKNIEDVLFIRTGEWKEYYKNGNIKRFIWYDSQENLPYKELKIGDNGIKENKILYFKNYYKNGTIKAEYKARDENEKVYREYYKKSTLDDEIQLKLIRSYDLNTMNTSIKEYYEDGNIKLSGVQNYEMSVLNPKNEWVDEYTEYYKSGSIKKIKHFDDYGYKYGVWTEYFSNGEIEKKETWKIFNGRTRRWSKRIGSSKSYYKDGQIRFKGKYSEDGKQGEWIEYYSDASLKSKGNYKDGEGEFKRFYLNGNKKYYKKFDILDFVEKEWYENGQIKLSSKNLKFSRVITNEWYKNGQIKSKLGVYYYENGQVKFKNNKYYYKDGKLLRSQISTRSVGDYGDEIPIYGGYYHKNGKIKTFLGYDWRFYRNFYKEKNCIISENLRVDYYLTGELKKHSIRGLNQVTEYSKANEIIDVYYSNDDIWELEDGFFD